MARAPVVTDPGWIAHFAEDGAPVLASGSRPHWRRELAEFNEELRSRFACCVGDRRILGRHVRDAVAAHFGVTRAELAGAGRDARYVTARQIAMYICVRFAGLSSTQTGALFGDRDHTTVLHSVHRAAARIAADPALGKTIDALVAACRNRADHHPTTSTRVP